jgi:hypothetical protein
MMKGYHCPCCRLYSTMKISLGETDADGGTVSITTHIHIATHSHINNVTTLIVSIRAGLPKVAD